MDGGVEGFKYKVFKLKNREFTFDVDVSQLPCGLNGALYFVVSG
jgi:cellulose 1,4-beta-cellobiosidase